MKQKGNKKGFTDVPKPISGSYKKKAAFRQRTYIKTRFFHSPNFALLPTLHSDRSPAII